MPLSIKKQRLCWMYVNDAKQEYVSGNFLIAGHKRTCRFAGINEMIAPESGVGAVLLSLITPVCKKIDGQPVGHEFRGKWQGDTFYAINNKRDNAKWKFVEQNYQSLNLQGVDYLRTHKGWDRPLYETLEEYYYLHKPKDN